MTVLIDLICFIFIHFNMKDFITEELLPISALTTFEITYLPRYIFLKESFHFLSFLYNYKKFCAVRRLPSLSTKIPL